MKKILFLSYNYPYGAFGASTLCSSKVIRALCKTGKFEVHCVSYASNGSLKYELIPGIKIHTLPQNLKPTKQSRFSQLITLPLYPLQRICNDYKHYLYCKDICKKEKFDLVISQYYPESNLISAVLLKKKGYINNLCVIFWDNLYGKIPRRIIPKKFALYRQRLAENKLAKHIDALISLYPIKPFHDVYGDVANAMNKRFYLGIPSIIPPISPINTEYDRYIAKDKINILYSGEVINKGYITYIVNLLNQTSVARDINILFFSKGLTDDEFTKLKTNFSGSIHNFNYIPLIELYSIYSKVNIFLSLSGNPQSICSKCYEYMSYGHPIIHIYEDDKDVNVATFVRYRLSLFIDINAPISTNVNMLDQFIHENRNGHIDYDVVMNEFKLDTADAYVNFITQMLENKK